VVNGVSSGIGIETLRALYSIGAHVFATVRDMQKGQKVVDEIEQSTVGGRITLVKMELDSLASIKQGAEQILRQTDKLNLLVNNAG
jgi:NAD(P)-dependent dehydrogenase (short-subunit alcohol dehydrogenase family)